MQTPKYQITNESVTVILEGRTYSVRKGERNFDEVVSAILAKQFDSLPEMLVAGIAVEKWVGGDYSYDRSRNAISYKGEQLPESIITRIIKMTDAGADPSFLMNFWTRLQRNPSMRSVEQLYRFLEHLGIPIDKNGYLVAYKGVRSDYMDQHSGQFDNHPGQSHKMPRNKISDDPRVACHVGFHVGALGYARRFGARTIIVRVDPEHVVCVPYDHSDQKMRVCRYEVVGNYGDKLPDVFVEDLEVATPKPSKAPAKKTPAKKERPVKSVSEEDNNRALWGYLIDTPDSELHKKNLQHLRKYARHHLQIVRASKIPGGKPKLVERIIETRSGEQKQND